MSIKLFPADILDKLEFSKIKSLLLDQCISAMGREHVTHLLPSNNEVSITCSLQQISELKELANAGFVFPAKDFTDIEPSLDLLKINDYVLPEEDIHGIRTFVLSMSDIFLFIQTHQDIAPQLRSVIKDIKYDKQIEIIISRILDETGRVKSDASPELQKIRREVSQKVVELDRVFRKISQQLKSAGYVTDTGETIRNGRRVLSIFAENKRAVKGIIHDESDTGKTSFIEPEETVFLNNELFEFERAEKREIYRILKELSNDLRIYLELLFSYREIMGEYDFIRAKTKLSFLLNGISPGILKVPNVKMVKAFHPLLKMMHEKNKKSVIPHSASINDEQQMILISGPNAGGKSVAMKTFALLQLMFQSGLHIPADNSSELGIYDEIMADVGDSQSLEDELSTYSSRLQYMRYFLEHAGRKTIFYIDEFGTGTDPLFGGAIAEAILKELLQKQARGMINTHYGNLKLFAEKNRHIVNAAMVFDEENLKPTYQLQIGKPGSSYTFVIAEKSGLPSSLISYAKSLVGDQKVKYEELLNRVETERKDLEKVAGEIESQDKRLKELIRKFELQNKDIEYQKKKLKYEYYLQKHEHETKLEAELNRIIKEIKLNKKEEENAALTILKEVQNAKGKAAKVLDTTREELKSKKPNSVLKKGDIVRILDTKESGIIEEIKKEKALVAFDHLKTWISVESLELADKKKYDNKMIHQVGKHHILREEMKHELDIRGMMKEEAYPMIENFIDKAIIGQYNDVRIIHGKGSGALRDLVKNCAKGYKEIKGISHPAHEFGGDGITELKFY